LPGYLSCKGAEIIQFGRVAQQLFVVSAGISMRAMLVGDIAADFAVVFDGRPDADVDGRDHCTFGNH
jgi:hypothetical protein